MIFLSIIGALIAFFSFMSGVVIYGAAKSAIHEIYAALLMITAMLGLVMATIAAGAARIKRAIENNEDSTIKALRAVVAALHTLPGAPIPILPGRAEPRLAVPEQNPDTTPGGWPRHPQSTAGP